MGDKCSVPATERHIQEALEGALEMHEGGQEGEEGLRKGLILLRSSPRSPLWQSPPAAVASHEEEGSDRIRSASCCRTRSRQCAGCSSTRRCLRRRSPTPASRRSINNALNDPSKQKAQAQACLAAGAKVVIETSLDNGSASAIEKSFTVKGGNAIDYDRQVIGGTASVYDTFDGKLVGEAQAKRRRRGDEGERTRTSKSSIVAQLWGGQTDQNAFWFKSGNDAVLNPLFKHHKLKKGPQQFVPGWDANNAATIYDQMLLKTHNKIKGIIAANDNIAGAVIADEKAHHLKPIPLSGQDASAAGVQYILAGWQTGTVYKRVSLEANAAAAAAIALLHGKKPKTNGFRLNG